MDVVGVGFRGDAASPGQQEGAATGGDPRLDVVAPCGEGGLTYQQVIDAAHDTPPGSIADVVQVGVIRGAVVPVEDRDRVIEDVCEVQRIAVDVGDVHPGVRHRLQQLQVVGAHELPELRLRQRRRLRRDGHEDAGCASGQGGAGVLDEVGGNGNECGVHIVGAVAQQIGQVLADQPPQGGKWIEDGVYEQRLPRQVGGNPAQRLQLMAPLGLMDVQGAQLPQRLDRVGGGRPGGRRVAVVVHHLQPVEPVVFEILDDDRR